MVCVLASVSLAQSPSTSFQAGEGWTPAEDIRSDAAIVYSCDKPVMDSWAKRGYVIQTMGGFRTDPDYIKQHPEEGQTTRKGVILTCGPDSFYMVPTDNRIRVMVDYFVTAIRNGSTAVIPEEPEYFADAGYEQSFKDAWQQRYNEPWQDPASSFDARIKAERLKGEMEAKMIRSILQAAQKENPQVRRMVAHHSPVNYHGWGISFPFDTFAKMQELQEVVGQVWTGTARTPCLYHGQSAERTFENALLEYSSLVELYRGTGKRLWFLADPLEDNPDRTMQDYRSNYTHTLAASLMFPEVNAYELLPWPSRIYGRVPADYATALGCVFNALQEVSRLPVRPEPGGGVCVLIGDSAAYQRAAPSPNELTGFYGLTLPFIYAGVPVRVAPVERVTEPGYLKAYGTVVVSYDYFKPMRPECNTALAQWVRGGGRLVLAGGGNAYNQAGQWWRTEDFASPDQHLLKLLGLPHEGVPASSAVTLYRGEGSVEPLEEAKAFVSSAERRAPGASGAFQARVGKGTFVFVGLPAEDFAERADVADLLPVLAGKARVRAGFRCDRGNWTAVHAQTSAMRLKGRWIDLMDASLPILESPSVPAGDSRFFRKVSNCAKPEVLAASYQTLLIRNTAEEMVLRNTGPEGTPGALRVHCAGRQVKSVEAVGVQGGLVKADHSTAAGTVYVTFPGSPEGVTVTIRWAQ